MSSQGEVEAVDFGTANVADRIREMAYFIWLGRIAAGRAGNQQTDWDEATAQWNGTAKSRYPKDH